MKPFFLNCINNIVKGKRENKVKHLLNFILAKQRGGHLHDDDVVYPVSTLCSFLHALSQQVGRPGGDEHPTLTTPTAPRTRTTAVLHFVRTSELHVRSFVDALLKQFHAKGDASEEAIRSCTYLLNALCLLDYDNQASHSSELLSRVVNAFVQLNRRYLNDGENRDQRGQVPQGTRTQLGVETTQEDSYNSQVRSQMLTEVLTVINKHFVKLKMSNEHMNLVSVFYLEVINYLFASNVLRVMPPEDAHHTYEHGHMKTEPYPRVVVTTHINANHMNLNRIKQFYSEVHLDVHHFVSIALFVKKYAGVLNRFQLRQGGSPRAVGEEATDHLRRTLNETIVQIYLNLFWRSKWDDKSSQGSYPNGRQHICNEDTDLGRVPFHNAKKEATSYPYLEQNQSLQGDPSNPTSPFLLIWSYFPHEFTQLYNSQKIKIDLVINQNVMNLVSCLNALSLTQLASDWMACDHFNKQIYTHILSFKLLLHITNGGKNFPRRDFLLNAFFVYNNFWHFIIKFYASVLYTNSLVSLLGCFCAGRVKGITTWRSGHLPIRIINEEVLRRWKRGGTNYMYSPSSDQAFNRVHTPQMNYLPGALLTPQCPLPLMANKRHLFNMCSFYAQVNFHDEAFARVLAKTTTHNLTRLGQKDIMAVVYYLGNATPTGGGMLFQLVVTHIERHITTYDMCDLHLLLKTLLKYTHQQEGEENICVNHITTVLHHILIRILIVCCEMDTKDKAAPQLSRHGKTKEEEMIPQQLHFTKTLHEFYHLLLSCQRLNSMLITQRSNTTQQVAAGTTALSITQEEMQAVYSKLLRARPDFFTPSTGMLTKGEKNPFLRDTLNILNVVVKLMKNNRFPSLYETCCIPMCDAMYLLTKRNKNPLYCFSVSEWVSLLLCHCKVGHIPDYLNEYLSRLRAQLPTQLHAERWQFKGVHMKDLHLIRILSHRLKSLHLKNAELFAPFSVRAQGRHPSKFTPVCHVLGAAGEGRAFITAPVITRLSNRNCYPHNTKHSADPTATQGIGRRNHFQLRGSLNDYIYKLLLRRFKKVTHKDQVNTFKSVLSPLRSYNIDFLFSCTHSISEIKKKISEYIYELKLVDAQNFKVVYLGKRRLVRPIKKQLEAYYVLFSFQIYPSLISEVKRKLLLQDAVLRFIVTKNEKTSKTLEYEENGAVRRAQYATEAKFFQKNDS
ncbi:ribosomal protein S6 [Plasmodium fragile]|uniref:Ribosomal protein S6 n=1 Tax=Plasmodium fragile TaxID=5857 RepID=A0A0D9QI93_PLAFR|nr:ribosomal protein S6 [Plasmodium fragile]KJP86785.1 ribosomal protein S6 [Plasmodium fragile]